MPFFALLFPAFFFVIVIVAIVSIIRGLQGGGRSRRSGNNDGGTGWSSSSGDSDTFRRDDSLEQLRYHQAHTHHQSDSNQSFHDDRRDYHQSQDVPDSYGSSSVLDSSPDTSCGGGSDFGSSSSDSCSSSDSGSSSSDSGSSSSSSD